jgi:formate dehydrogenase
MTTSERTFCRICEAYCGLTVELDGQRVGAIRADRDHPVSQGYACVKGLGLGALHDDPDRVNTPLKRVGDRFEPISWPQALEEIGRKVRALHAAHGPRAVAMYQGNPSYFSFQNVLYSSAFLEALHSPNLFASHSVDTNNKLHVSTAIYGLSLVHPVPDFEHTRFFMCLGSNPMVSQMSVIQVARPLEKLQAIEARGGRVVIVDPRRSETARRVGQHVAIRPGTDAYLLVAMLHVITHERRADLQRAQAVAAGVDELVRVAAPWTPERAAPVTGIPAATIRELAGAYADADGAALYMSTGVNMGPFGSLAYWLVQGLNLITGNLDRRGGVLVPEGAFDALTLARWLGLGRFDATRTLDGRWHRVAGAFPLEALPEEITSDHPERIRALFVSAGNPVHAMPDGARLARALERLELVVSIDLYRNETARAAHYVLPATDMLERSDFNVSHQVLQVVPHAQYTPALVAPLHERREEWRIFSDLALACGASPLGKSVCNLLPHLNRWLRRLPLVDEIRPEHLLALLLRWGGKVTLAELREAPGGVLLPPTRPGSFLGHRVATEDGKVQLGVPALIADATRLESLELELSRDDVLRLIGRRERRTHNSWMHNNRHLRQPAGNTALLHPDDAAARGIAEGDLVEIRGGAGALRLPVSLTDDVRRGVVVVPHGWGHDDAPALAQASALGGGNVNRAIPGGAAHMDPVSGQAIMLAHVVDVQRVAPPGAVEP